MGKVTIDLDKGVVTLDSGGTDRTLPFGDPEAFDAISRAWLRSGWDAKYVYSFSWLGRPVIQLPEDMFRLQEVIYTINPDVIIETGIAHGGSLVFYAGLCKVMERGRVVGIDIDIRQHNRQAIEGHVLAPLITLIEGSSIDPAVIGAVKAQVGQDEKTLVLLDSDHTKEHVLAELNAYAPLVSPGSYVVAMDGIMEQLVGAPRTRPDWSWNNPRQAVLEFVGSNPDFAIVEPPFLFNEGDVRERVTYWPSAFVKRVR